MVILIVFGTVLPWHSDRGKHPIGTKVRNWSEHYRVIDEQCEEWACCAVTTLVQRYASLVI